MKAHDLAGKCTRLSEDQVLDFNSYKELLREAWGGGGADMVTSRGCSVLFFSHMSSHHYFASGCWTQT